LASHQRVGTKAIHSENHHSTDMNRPFIVSLLGWLGVLGGLLHLIGVVVLICFSDLRQQLLLLKAQLPNLSVDTLIGSYIFVIVLILVPYCGLLMGKAWARVIFSLLYGFILLAVLFFWQFMAAMSSEVTTFMFGPFCFVAGLPVVLLCLLYSPNCNLFFHPEKEPIPFNHYETFRQIIMLLAVLLIAFGGYRIWEIKTGRLQPPALATATDPNAPKPIRTFTNTQGVAIQARLIYFDGGQVILEREDGRRFTNPITIYSDQDQAYIRQQPAR